MRTIRSFHSLLWLTLPLLATPTLAGEKAAISAESIKAQITYLASDALRGRGSGEPGNMAAARFIAQEFARCGLKPIGTSQQTDTNAPMNGSGYFQPFPFIAGRAVGKNNRLEFNPEGDWTPLRPNRDFEPSSISGDGKAEGKLVFVGYGIRTPQGDHDDYKGMNVKDKIVLLLAGHPTNDPHSPLAEYADVRRKALTARELGAKAVLIALPDKSDLPGQTIGLGDVSDAGLPVLRVRFNITQGILTSVGVTDFPKLIKEADEGKNVSQSLNLPVRLAADVKKVPKVTANVVGLIEGSDPVLKNEVVVIGAHLDHLGMGGPDSLDPSHKPAIHHGADDNASGTAGVLQLAAWFGQPKGARTAAQGNAHPRLKRSLLLMCFSGEELGLLGSDYYVKHPILPLDKTVAMLNMDMIGRLRDNKLVLSGSGTAKEWNALLDAVNQTSGFTIARSESGFGASDQQSFYTKEIPVLFFFTGLHDDYHRPSDTADKINAEGEARVIQMVAECAERIADSPERPTFERMKTTEQSGVARAFRVYFGSVPDYAFTGEGVQLSGVRENSPAAKAGLKAGDIILKFAGKTVKNVQDYTYALQDCKPGDEVEIVVKRGDETLNLKATLISRPQ